MDFSTVIEFLSKQEGGSEMADAVKERLHQVNLEAKGIRERLKAFDGIDIESFKTTKSALEELGIKDPAEIKKLKEQADKASGKDTELGQLAAKFQQLEETLRSEKQLREKVQQEGRREKTLNKMLASKDRIFNPLTTLSYHIDKGEIFLSDAGEVTYKDAKGVAAVTEALLSDYPDAARTVARPGAGGGGSGAGAETNTITRAQYDLMDPGARLDAVRAKKEIID